MSRTHNNIPTITNLIEAGDPAKKIMIKNYSSGSKHLEELNQRIDEIEDAIGQDNSGPVGRAFAIRAEASDVETIEPEFMTDFDLQK